MTKNNYSKKVREVMPLLKKNGFRVVGIKGSHIKFKDDIGNTIVVNNNLNEMVRKRIEKEVVSARKGKTVKLIMR